MLAILNASSKLRHTTATIFTTGVVSGVMGTLAGLGGAPMASFNASLGVRKYDVGQDGGSVALEAD